MRLTLDGDLEALLENAETEEEARPGVGRAPRIEG